VFVEAGAKIGAALSKYNNDNRQIFQDMSCAIARAMGATFRNVPNDQNDVGWASKEVQDGFLSGFSAEEQSQFMEWDKRYCQFKALIDSCLGDKDVCNVMKDLSIN
jgi:hypothetical protein